MSLTTASLADRVGRDRVVYRDEQTILICARFQDVAPMLPAMNATVTDPPYSARTHTAYRDQEQLRRRPISYEPWGEAEVRECVDFVSPLTLGWFVAMCDHVLAPIWEQALQGDDRYVFAPLMCVEPGSRVRQCGDGPAQWSCYAVPGRPSTAAFAKWGALPGAYVVPPGENRTRDASNHRIGGKPLWLMRQLVSDYSREGDWVLDPCAGYATTGRAAKDLNRYAVLIEENEAACEAAARRMRPARAYQESIAFESVQAGEGE